MFRGGIKVTGKIHFCTFGGHCFSVISQNTEQGWLPFFHSFFIHKLCIEVYDQASFNIEHTQAIFSHPSLWGGRRTVSGAPGFREMAPGEREEESNIERGVKEGVRSSGRKALVPECVWYRKSSSLALIIHAFLCTMDLPRQRFALDGKKKKKSIRDCIS